VAKRPELKNVEPFKTVLSGNRQAMTKLSRQNLEYAYGPAQGLPGTRVGAFTQALYDELKSAAGRSSP
jgi:hypothetical protein